MKKIYLVRHAKSSWDNPAATDIERPLNERGLNDAPFMAKLLRNKNIKPDLIVTSPAIRAMTTAAYFKNELGVAGEDFLVRDEIYEAMSFVIVELINRLPETCDSVMIFGHNPTFTNVANLFTKKYIDNMPTCGIVCIQSDADSWLKVSSNNAQVTDLFFPKEFSVF